MEPVFQAAWKRPEVTCVLTASIRTDYKPALAPGCSCPSVVAEAANGHLEGQPGRAGRGSPWKAGASGPQGVSTGGGEPYRDTLALPHRLDVRGGRSSLGSTVVGGHADRKPGLWLDTSVIQTVPSPDFRFKLNTPSAQPRKREEPTCYQEPVQEALEEPSRHCPGSQQHTEASLLPVPSWPRGLGGVPSHPEATAPHHSS